MGAAELRRLKQLKVENKKLKQFVDDLSLDKKMLQDVVQGKPTDNAFIESFNGRLRQECLNQHWLLSLEDARKNWIPGGRITTSGAPQCIGQQDASRVCEVFTRIPTGTELRARSP
ncbi:hypothetical protein Pan110_53380 [Gimesia panareensis]|nr:hypothetical protein Pan110_53380 [Gimesia panareensis]